MIEPTTGAERAYVQALAREWSLSRKLDTLGYKDDSRLHSENHRAMETMGATMWFPERCAGLHEYARVIAASLDPEIVAIGPPDPAPVVVHDTTPEPVTPRQARARRRKETPR